MNKLYGIAFLMFSALLGQAQELDTLNAYEQIFGTDRVEPYSHCIGLRYLPTLWEQSNTDPNGVGIGLVYKASKKTRAFRAALHWVNFENGRDNDANKINDTTVLVQYIDHAIDLYELRLGHEWYANLGRINILVGADAIFAIRHKDYWLSSQKYNYFLQQELSQFEESEPSLIPYEQHFQIGIRPTVGLHGFVTDRLQAFITGGPELVKSYATSKYKAVPGTSYNERHKLFVQFTLTFRLNKFAL